MVAVTNTRQVSRDSGFLWIGAATIEWPRDVSCNYAANAQSIDRRTASGEQGEIDAPLVFRSFRSTPAGLEEYINERETEAATRSFMERSSDGVKGSIYFADVGALVTKYYQLIAKKS